MLLVMVFECLCQQVFQGLLPHFYSLMVLWIQNQVGNITELYGHALNKSLFLFGMWYVSPPGSTVS